MIHKVPRIYTGDDGASHFGEVEIPMVKAGKGWQSAPVKAKEVTFVMARGKEDHDWHPAPRRQLVVVLEGTMEMEIGDGSKRTFGPGEIILAEDTTGQGHITRNVNRKAILVPLA